MIDNILIFIYIFLDLLPFAIPRYYLFLDCLAIPIKHLAFILISIIIIEAFGFIYLENDFLLKSGDKIPIRKDASTDIKQMYIILFLK